MKSKVTLLNVLSSVLLQCVTIISGFIVPKLILSYFGSNVNGLISSLNQFLSYISLIEGGITGVIVTSLYKPCVEKDEKKISSIIITANSFFKKIGWIFLIYSLVLSIIYPTVFNTGFTFEYVFFLTLILSLNLFIQYMFCLSLKSLFTADKKVYVTSFVQTLIILLNLLLVYISLKIYPNVHLLKFISGIVYIIQPLFYGFYFRKHYTFYSNEKKDNELIKNRWNGFSINIASFIHFSTDIVILTIFCDFATVSIYSVYALVTNGLRQIVNSLTNGLNPTIGQEYAKNKVTSLNNKMDVYEYIILMLVFIIFSIAGLLITPFVLIYTKGVTDANYNQVVFGVLLVISEALYIIKYPHLNLAYAANKFNEITIPAYIEAAINILFSIIFVKFFGLNGVVIGTIIAMLYRMIFHVYFTKKSILKDRNTNLFYKKILICLLFDIVCIFICESIFKIKMLSIQSWVLYGFIYLSIYAIAYYIVSILFFKKEFLFIKKYVMKKR